MSQTDDIHESFYDLFNQRFRRIDDPQDGARYYTNIAIGAHIKPCRVHPDFECIVMVKESELKDIPPPFLNRFEKYLLSHEQVLEAALNHLPPCLTLVLRTALDKVSPPRWIIRWLTSSLLAFLITQRSHQELISIFFSYPLFPPCRQRSSWSTLAVPLASMASIRTQWTPSFWPSYHPSTSHSHIVTSTAPLLWTATCWYALLHVLHWALSQPGVVCCVLY